MNIKPIETHYKGYRFRSRLEARWAVFFDYCEYPFEYEPEGYKINGVSYLPDFKVNRMFDGIPTIWFEVKPLEGLTAKQQDEANDKIYNLAYASGIPGILVFGAPWDGIFCLYKQTETCSRDGSTFDIARYPGKFGKGYTRTEQYACDVAKAARFEYGENR